MAECGKCGRPTKPDDWTCGSCGAPLREGGAGGGAAAPPDPYGYAPGYEPATETTAAPSADASGRLRLVVILAVVAIMAIIAVWFFALRGPSTTGNEFLGTWNATGAGVGTVSVARGDDSFRVALTGDKAGQTATVPAHLDGRDLVITIDDFAQMAGDQNADAVKAMLKAMAGDFRLVFQSIDPTHLRMTIEGSTAIEEGIDTTILEKTIP